jgi:hypothetical protein
MAIQLSGSLAITGSLVATSQIVAQTLNVQQVTSSIVYSSGSNIFGNSVSNTQQFTGSLQVSSSTSYILGNVGIGTSSPGTNLQVNGGSDSNIRVVSSAGGYSAIQFGDTSDTVRGAISFNSTDNSISVRGYNNEDRLLINSSGYVGIGVTTPTSILDILTSAVSSDGNYQGIRVQDGTIQSWFTNWNVSGTRLLRIGTGTANPIQLYTGGSNVAMHIATDSNIGIGTTNPGYTLDVSGSLKTTAGTYLGTNSSNVIIGGATSDLTNQFKFITIGNTAFQYGASTGTYLRIEPGNADTEVALKADARSGAYPPMTFYTTATERMRIKADGNVGIGTTTVGAKVVVKGTSTTDNLNSQIQVYNDSGKVLILGAWPSSQAVTFAQNHAIVTTGGTTNEDLLLGADGSGGNIRFFTNDWTSGNERMRIASGGNVGVGTTVPNSTFQVSKGGATFQVTDTNKTASNTFSVYGSSQTSWTIATGNSGSFSGGEKIVINDNGNIGIGTTSPTRLLELYGPALTSDTPTLRISSADSSGTRKFGIEFYSRTGADVRGKIMADNGGRLYIDDNGGGGIILQGNGGTGNVGISTTSPVAKLHVTSVTVNPTAAALQADSKFVIAGVDGNMDLMSQDDGSTVSNTIGFGRYNASNGDLIHKFGIVSWANTGNIGSNTGDRIGFHYGTGANTWDSTELMTIKAGGNVGIGTTNPTSKLLVAGTLTATDTITITSGTVTAYLSYTSTNGVVGTQTNHGLQIRTNNTARIFIDGDGNVGIGTTSPSRRLTVSQGTGTYTNAYMSFNNASERWTIGNEGGFGGGSNDFIFYNTDYRMVINSGGNVGIGTTSPASRLHVEGANDDTYGQLRIVSTGTGADAQITFGTPLNGRGMYLDDSDTNKFKIYTGYGKGSREVTFDNEGNVGIGTTSPIYKLDVWGGPGDVARFKSVNSSESLKPYLGSTYKIFQTNDNDQFGYFGTQFYITVNSGVTEAVRINTNGNVGIGTTSPNFRLSVNDNSNYVRTTQSGYGLPTVEWNDKSRFKITNGSAAYRGIRTNSLGYKYVRIEADLKNPSSGGTDHFGFFWGANQDDLGISTGVTGYKWVWNPGNSYITLRDINTNTNITNSSTLSFAYNDDTWHHWVVEVRPEGVYISVDGVVILTAADIYSVGGYCGLLIYNTGYLDVANFNITSLPNEYTKIYKSTTELAGFPAGYYYFSNSNGEVQQLYYDNGYILVASNNATDNTLPKGTGRNSTLYQVNRNGAMGHLGFPSPDRDYLIGGWVNNFTFSGGKVVGFGRGSTNGTYTWSNLGTYITATWNASSFVGATAAASVTIGGNSSLSTSAAYFTLDAVRNDSSLDANTNQSTIGGAGTQGSDGDPSSGCYLGHGSTEGTIGCEGWYDSSNISADSQGYTTWIKT